MTYAAFEEFVLNSHWKCRMFPGTSKSMIRVAVEQWQAPHGYSFHTAKEAQKAYAKRIKGAAEKKGLYGFDPLTWLIIGVVVNVIVRIILEWWFNDREATGPISVLAQLKVECQQ